MQIYLTICIGPHEDTGPLKCSAQLFGMKYNVSDKPPDGKLWLSYQGSLSDEKAELLLFALPSSGEN